MSATRWASRLLLSRGFRPQRRIASLCSGAAVAVVGGSVAATVVKKSTANACCEEETDRLKSWTARWESTNPKGWELKHVNPNLVKYFDVLLPAEQPGSPPVPPGMGRRVLVPLCGKTLDMAYIARRGFRVLGVEGVGKAIQEFATEHGVTEKALVVLFPPAMDPELFKGHAVLIGAAADEPVRESAPPPVIIVEGDFLKLGPSEAAALVPCDAVFDRGSLVAVEPKDRARYAEVLGGLVTHGGRVLLVTIEHDTFADGRLGPPYEVTEADVRTLFEKDFDVQLLQREDILKEDVGMRNRGVTRCHQGVYLMKRRPAV